MLRRSKVLIGILLALLSVLAVVFTNRWNVRRRHEAHWQAIDERAQEFARANRPMIAEGGVPFETNPAPDAEIVPGPTARFEPVELLWKKSDWNGKLLTTVSGCQPIAPDTDSSGPAATFS